MKRALLFFMMLSGLCRSHTASAQFETTITLNKSTFNIAVPMTNEQARQLYEEIEIMRRLLDRGLHAQPGLFWAVKTAPGFAFVPIGNVPIGNVVAGGDLDIRLWNTATGKQVGDGHHAALLEFQGVYLKGHGVVYSMTLPLHFQKPVKDKDTSAPKPLSHWEKVRQEVRGGKAEPDKPDRKQQETTLVEDVIKILAENGRNFTHLPENEQVTVAITLQPSQACTKCHKETGAAPASDPNSVPWSYYSILKKMPGESVGSDAGISTSVKPLVPTGDGSLWLDFGGAQLTIPKQLEQEIQNQKAEARKQVLLGDLHAKQSQHDQAVEAYLKAAESYEKTLDYQRRVHEYLEATPPNTSPPVVARLVVDHVDIQTDLELVELYTKLAQSYLMQGKKDSALKYFRALAEHAQKTGKPETATKPAQGTAPVALPDKLIISAPRTLLDQGGKISPEDFAKQVRVEYLHFGPEQKEITKPKP